MFAMRLLSGGADTGLLWILWVLLGLFALAAAVGWLSSLRKPEQAGAESEAALPVAGDDLVLIEGIGPKVAKVLGRAGICTFEDLAGAKKADVQKILDQAGLQMMDPAGWIDQAKLAAKGDWDAFEKLKGSLKGGRKGK